MRRRRQDERGFAMLLVFAMAASVAIMLYMQLPRAAFEAQRQREEMLIDRGQQYMRGIQLYVAKNKRYPASLDDLEKSSRIRFIRRRYKDPMTGEDEWRVIKIDGAGRLIDSKVQKPEGQKKEAYQNTFISEGPSLGQTTAAGGTTGVNLALRRRASDNAVPGMGTPAEGSPGFEAPPPPPAPGEEPKPGQQPQTGGRIDPATGLPVADPQQQQPGQAPQQAQGQPPAPIGIGAQGAMIPGTGAPAPQQPQGGVSQTGANAATNLIGQMLTRPNPQLNPNNQQGGQALGAPMGAQQIGGGIAGVASKLETDSIKIYNERQRYDEWEFIYDFSKDKKRGTGNMQMPNQNQRQQGNQPGNQQQQQQNQNRSTFGR